MKSILILFGISFIFACKNNKIDEEWNKVKKNHSFDDIILFAAENVDNCYADSAISYLSDTSNQIIIAWNLVIRDSVDFEKNSVERYSDSYDCTNAPEPPFKDRVAFRIEIDNGLNIKVKNEIINADSLEKQIVIFLLNENNIDTLPPKRIEIFKDGLKVEITIAVVELYCDLYSNFFEDKYIKEMTLVMKKIFKSYEKIRSIKAQEIFNREYNKLTAEEKDILRTMNPLMLKLGIEGLPKKKDCLPLPTDLQLKIDQN